MKKIILINIVLLLFVSVKAQDSISWPNHSSSISVHASTLLFATPVNCSYSYMAHKGMFHIGVTTGLTFTFYELVSYGSLGAHATLAIFLGKKSHHFETKLGFTYNILPVYSLVTYTDYDDYKFLPVISMGYRYQPPESRTFWRISLSTGGIGFGYGWLL